MPIPGEQPDLTALPPETSPVKRRLAAQHVREARDRLTSTSGTRPAFDYELLRQFAQNRLSASLVILLLVATIGFLSSLWTGAVDRRRLDRRGAGHPRRHHHQVPAIPRRAAERRRISRAWRLRFVMLDLFFGLAWMFILIHPVGADESSGTFMLFVMLLVVAVSSMLASSLPIAVFAADLAGHRRRSRSTSRCKGTLHDYILAIMAVTAQGYFAAARLPALFDRRWRRWRRAPKRTR